ncbi:hypothetical protein [Bryobacter aggregatus]|uniref:hypothetical protein n=1 Tax=Bryobacter aggregatus TaxID=360054 RepID=UPI0004E1CD9D|nr:hypothetical protein [Bryobacter aggregatus]
MSLVEKIRNLIEDPPPAYAFEIGPAGLAHWQNGSTRFEAMPAPSVDDIAHLLARVAPPTGSKKRAAAVILPDNAARITLMDFDMFPRKVEEQLSLIRFRLKRTLPFDIETAVLRYQTIPRGGNKVDLTVAAMAVETLAPYEAVFRAAGFHPGYITIAGLSAANLAQPNTITLRLSGLTLTLTHLEGTELKLFRCLELQDGSLDEILNVLDPTLAFLEDERKLKPARIDLCGLGELTQTLETHLAENWQIPAQALRSRAGVVDANNAGLMGYLESAGVQ